jgi:hypothetical protein
VQRQTRAHAACPVTRKFAGQLGRLCTLVLCSAAPAHPSHSQRCACTCISASNLTPLLGTMHHVGDVTTTSAERGWGWSDSERRDEVAFPSYIPLSHDQCVWLLVTARGAACCWPNVMAGGSIDTPGEVHTPHPCLTDSTPPPLPLGVERIKSIH